MIVPAPLVLLIAMRLRAAWRRFARSLRTVRGLVLTLAGAAVAALMLVPAIVGTFTARAGAESIATNAEPYVPFVILAFLALSIVRTRSDQALAFLQAEVDVLFAAPFTRRQLLAYKLAQRVAPLFFVSLFFSLWARVYAHSWLSAWIGILLALWLLHLASLCLALAGQVVERRLFARFRRGAVVALVAIVATCSWWAGRSFDAAGLLEGFQAFVRSPAAPWVVAPVIPFARAFSATSFWTECLPWAGFALAINVALLAIAMRIDANWLEASAESSRKLNVRIEELRRTGGMPSGAPSLVRIALPMPPRWRGFGPLAWRQAMAGMRRGGRGLFIVLLFVGSASLPLVLSMRGDAAASTKFAPLLGVLVGYLSLFLPNALRLDFRGDIDCMDVMKSLPVTPFALAAAQVATPATLVTLLQVVLGVGAVLVFAWPVPALPMWCAVLFAANLLIAAIDNAVFLLWPARPKQGFGMSFASAQVILQIGKTLALVLLLGAGAGAGAAAYALSEDAWIALLAATIVIAVEATTAIVIVGRLFARFDPSHERVADA